MQLKQGMHGALGANEIIGLLDEEGSAIQAVERALILYRVCDEDSAAALTFHIEDVLRTLDANQDWLGQHPRELARLLLRLVYGDVDDPDYWHVVAPWCLRWCRYITHDVTFLVLYGLNSFIDTATRDELVTSLRKQGMVGDNLDTVTALLRDTSAPVLATIRDATVPTVAIPVQVVKILAGIFMGEMQCTPVVHRLPIALPTGHAHAIRMLIAPAYTPTHLR